MNKLKKLVVVLASAFFVLGGMGLINKPANAALFGTDVSSYQPNYNANDWDFALVKATEGTNYVNPLMYQQSLETEQKGKHLGYYHYLRSDSDVIAQADFFVSQLSAEDIANPDVALVLDFEENAVDGNHFTGDEPKQFMDEVKRLTGKQMVLYTSYYFATGADGRFAWYDIANDAPLWVAMYPSSGNTEWNEEIQAWANEKFLAINDWATVTMWQYGDGGRYDRDILYGNDWSTMTKNSQRGIQDQTPHVPEKNVTDTVSLDGVYVVDNWQIYGTKWYARNNDMSIPVADYNNDIPIQSVTLTDRYGSALCNQVAQGNNGSIEYFTLNDNYKVLSRVGNSIQIEMNGESVWLKLAYVK